MSDEIKQILEDINRFLDKHGRGTTELEFIAAIHDRILDSCPCNLCSIHKVGDEEEKKR